MLANDPLCKVLTIDLSKRRYWTESRPDLFGKWLGGTGVATALLADECPKGADPLGPDNPIVLAVGPLSAVYPLGSKAVAMFKSPLTGNLGESHGGGRTAAAIRLAGYGAIVIRGRSESPVYLAVHGDQVHFRDASSLWGIRSSFTVGRLIRQREPGAGYRTILRIGRAGELGVRYACVTMETYRHFGRIGLGAVFGSKKLKALVVSGRGSLPIADRKLYRQTYDEIYQAAVDSPLMKKYHDVGTAENVSPLNALKGLPTRNLQQAEFESADKISGERLAKDYLGRRVACSHCPVGCVHLAALREPSEHEPYFYKTSMICYDYEPIYALGSMLGGSDPEGLLKLMDQIEVYGLDAMSTGVVLAWATEAMERGLISDRETNGLSLKWGAYPEYLEAVKFIVDQPSDFYQALALGVEEASQRYGGAEFALAFGKNEMPGYHTGPAAHIGALIGARHSHLDNGGYSFDQKAFSAGKTPTPQEVVDALLEEERWRQVLSSLVVCFFARKLYSEETVVRALRAMGFDLTEDALVGLGQEIHRAKYAFKVREGFTLDKIRIPRRILETPALSSQISEDFMRDALARFQQAIAE